MASVPKGRSVWHVSWAMRPRGARTQIELSTCRPQDTTCLHKCNRRPGQDRTGPDKHPSGKPYHRGRSAAQEGPSLQPDENRPGDNDKRHRVSSYRHVQASLVSLS
jgi:hypothetical protein